MSKIGYLRLPRAFKSVYNKHHCLGFCKGIRVPEPSPHLATNDARIRKGWLLQWTISSTVWLWLSYVRLNPWTNSATSMGSYGLRMINIQRALQSESQKCKLVSTIASLHINQKQIGLHPRNDDWPCLHDSVGWQCWSGLGRQQTSKLKESWLVTFLVDEVVQMPKEYLVFQCQHNSQFWYSTSSGLYFFNTNKSKVPLVGWYCTIMHL